MSSVSLTNNIKANKRDALKTMATIYDGNESKYPVKNGTRAWTKTFVILYVDYEQRERPLDLKCALYVIAIASGGWLLSKQIPMNHHYCHLQQNAALFDTYKYIRQFRTASFRFVSSFSRKFSIAFSSMDDVCRCSFRFFHVLLSMLSVFLLLRARACAS